MSAAPLILLGALLVAVCVLVVYTGSSLRLRPLYFVPALLVGLAIAIFGVFLIVKGAEDVFVRDSEQVETTDEERYPIVDASSVETIVSQSGGLLPTKSVDMSFTYRDGDSIETVVASADHVSIIVIAPDEAESVEVIETTFAVDLVYYSGREDSNVVSVRTEYVLRVHLDE